jgi:hypothetical protein
MLGKNFSYMGKYTTPLRRLNGYGLTLIFSRAQTANENRELIEAGFKLDYEKKIVERIHGGSKRKVATSPNILFIKIMHKYENNHPTVEDI